MYTITYIYKALNTELPSMANECLIQLSFATLTYIYKALNTELPSMANECLIQLSFATFCIKALLAILHFFSL